MNRAQIQARFRQLTRQQAKWEAAYSPVFQKALNDQYRPVLAYLRDHSVSETLALSNSLVSPDPLRAPLQALYLRVGVEAANSEYGFLLGMFPEIRQQKDFGFNQFFRNLMQAFFDSYATRKITQMTDTSRAWINARLQWAQDNQYDTINTAKMIRTADVNKYRSRLIARTELLGAASYGSRQGAQQTGLVMQKVWISAHHWNTRRVPQNQFDHWNAHMERVAMDEKFLIVGRYGAEYLDFPGDPAGSAGNICNCLCKVIYEPQRDASGRLLTA
jgi:hypothetical protein